MSKRSAKWDVDEDETNRQWSDAPGYSPLSKKIKMGIAIAAILLGTGIIHGLLNPSEKEPWVDEQIEALDCEGLQEWLINKRDSVVTGINYWYREATIKFLNECSSYG